MALHVFWDLGGTLVDTYPQLDEVLARVVTDQGGVVAIEEVARLTRQSTGTAITTLATRHGVAEEDFRRAEAALKRRWEHAPPAAMAGAAELMGELSAAGGLNLVITHRDRASALSLIAGLGLPVDDLVSTSDGHPRKPDPAMFQVLLRRHRLEPDECLAVGDRPIDAQAAHAAGIRAVVLESAAAPVEDEADVSIEVLDELRPLLGLGPAQRTG